MINAEYLAAQFYVAYCKAVGGKSFNGDPLPDWETFSTDPTKETQANGWREVAKTAMKFLVEGYR